MSENLIDRYRRWLEYEEDIPTMTIDLGFELG